MRFGSARYKIVFLGAIWNIFRAWLLVKLADFLWWGADSTPLDRLIYWRATWTLSSARVLAEIVPKRLLPQNELRTVALPFNLSNHLSKTAVVSTILGLVLLPFQCSRDRWLHGVRSWNQPCSHCAAWKRIVWTWTAHNVEVWNHRIVNCCQK
jgi:hypothetical protein